MSTLNRLYDVYTELLGFGFIKPMIIRNYNDEYILVHIFSDNDVVMCKIIQSKEDKTYAILVTNFQKDSVDCYEGEPVEFIIDRFIESNGLDKLDGEALARVIERTCNGMDPEYMKAEGLYNIPCKSFTIVTDVENDMFKVHIFNNEYDNIYRFKTGFEAFKFIYFINSNRINQFSYNKAIYPLLTLSMDLYLKFGDNVANEINTYSGNSIENTMVKLQSNNGYMAFSIDIFNGMNVIGCKIERYDYKFYGEFKVRKYEDILDFVNREYAIIK